MEVLVPQYHRDIVLLGAQGHGKTTLAAAFSRVMHDSFPDINTGKATTFQEINDVPRQELEEPVMVMTHKGQQNYDDFGMYRLNYNRAGETTTLYDFPTFGDYAGALSEGVLPRTWNILVIDAEQGVRGETKDLLKLITHNDAGPAFRNVAVAITHCDTADPTPDEETGSGYAALATMALAEVGVRGSEEPVFGLLTPTKALAGDQDEAARIRTFLKAVDLRFTRPAS
ncbi:GTP-binding protein [Streptomyces anulatus]|uniref:GTP-binding protein n=1 Tax=Streptomyces anulatus TaxID=1892 RepID=UPI0034007EBE